MGHSEHERDRALSDSRLRAFVDAVFDAYYDWYIQSGRMEFSAQMDHLLWLAPGSSPKDLDGWLARIHPADRDRVFENNMRAVMEGGMYEGEYRLRRGDGSYVWIHDRGVILQDELARSSHMIGAMRDITAERQAARALREAADLYESLFAQAVNPAFLIAAGGRFLDANEAGLAFFGIDRRLLLRASVASLWGNDAERAVETTMDHGGAATTLRLELDVDGMQKSLAVTLIPTQYRGRSSCFALGSDITEHRQLQRALESSQESLRRQAEALEDTNTALRVILDQRTRDRNDLERAIVNNLETTVMPLLEQLRRHTAATPEAIYVDAVVQNLRELVQPFSQTLDGLTEANARLTPREREIATLVRAGKSSTEIAAALYISPTTVAFHRKNLRRKLGLPLRGPSLVSHLSRSPQPASSQLPGGMEEGDQSIPERHNP